MSIWQEITQGVREVVHPGPGRFIAGGQAAEIDPKTGPVVQIFTTDMVAGDFPLAHGNSPPFNPHGGTVWCGRPHVASA